MTVEVSARPQGICGVVLAGAYPKGGALFDRLRPRPLLPVAHEPLIVYPLRWLAETGLSRAVVCVNGPARAVSAAVGQASDLQMVVDFVEDWMPRGAAGCVRDAAQLVSAEVLVVVDGTSIPQVDLEALLETHRASDAALTIAVHEDPGPDGSRPALCPAGMYVFDRRALGYISEHGFQDIKETLVPRLHRAGEQVALHRCGSASPRVLNAETYLSVNRWVVSRLGAETAEHDGYERRGEALIARSAQVAADVLLVGPVVLGPNVRVHESAAIVGPSAVGSGCRIEPGAVVARSVLWSRCRLGADSTLDRCILADHAVVARETVLYNSVKAGSPRPTPSVDRTVLKPSLRPDWVHRVLSLPVSPPQAGTGSNA